MSTHLTQKPCKIDKEELSRRYRHNSLDVVALREFSLSPLPLPPNLAFLQAVVFSPRVLKETLESSGIHFNLELVSPKTDGLGRKWKGIYGLMLGDDNVTALISIGDKTKDPIQVLCNGTEDQKMKMAENVKIFRDSLFQDILQHNLETPTKAWSASGLVKVNKDLIEKLKNGQPISNENTPK